MQDPRKYRTPLLVLGLLLVTTSSFAQRLAVVAVASAHGEPPVREADALTSQFIAQEHRTIASADVLDRLLSGNDGAGADWAAERNAEIARGRAALTRLDRHAAFAAARSAHDSIRRVGGGAGGSSPLVGWALLEASLARSAGDDISAQRWTAVAASVGPDSVLDPLSYPEAERQGFDDAVTAARGQTTASLRVISVPSSAELWIDGVMRCRTPCAPQVPPGLHFVRVASPAHAPAAFEVTLTPGQQASRQLGLTSAYTGASIPAIASMLANPSRSAEAQSALGGVARFLDVDRVIMLRRGAAGAFEVSVAPVQDPAQATRRGVRPAALESVVDAMLARSQQQPPGEHDDGAWYESTALWIGVASAAALGIGAAFYFGRQGANDTPTRGTLVIGAR